MIMATSAAMPRRMSTPVVALSPLPLAVDVTLHCKRPETFLQQFSLAIFNCYIG